ncbi:MAG: segregation/condensation protein A, partial [Clostridia bacterium]|nr:segregation/condensation protein A [Clostridia bacterium]
NIYDIPLTELIDQYLEQIKLYEQEEMELGSEFLEMASRLIYIKTVSLLPKHDEVVKLKEELTGELLEYMVCQQIAKQFSTMQGGFDKFVRKPAEVDFDKTYELVHTSDVLYLSYLSAVGRGKRRLPPSTAPFTKIVAKKIVSVSTKIVFVIRKLFGGKRKLISLYKTAESRSELVATFLAVLELCKANRVKIEGDAENQEITLIKGHNKR